MPELRLLAIADIHYAPTAADAADAPADRLCEQGRRLLRGAVADAAARGGFDAVALLGDMVNDGSRQYAAGALRELRAELDAATAGAARLIVPGNHDGDPQRLFELLGGRAGLHEVGGYRLVVFADTYVDQMYGRRSDADGRLLAEEASRPGGPLVVLQHNPMNPVIAADYPYMLTNRDAVVGDYAEAGALVSISGHYHAGQSLNVLDGVHFLTVPALCESPCRYALLTLRDGGIGVRTPSLQAGSA